MGIGTSIFLLAVGAILAFAVNDTISGIELSTVGLILMGAGLLGLVLSMAMMSRTRRTVVAREPVVRERDVY